jgi:hypothetical protein
MSVISSFEPLSHDEERERSHLERKVERAFYEAGLALQQLRDKKLYRSTHSNFRDYCRERFGFGKSAVYYLISAVEIVDNLKKCPQFVDTLPVTESQVRPLKSLPTPDLQRQAWGMAVEKAEGIPSAKVVKEIVNQIKGQEISVLAKNNPQIEEAEFVPIGVPKIGQQVRITSKHPLFPSELGIITQLPNNRSAIVELDNKNRQLINLEDLEIQRFVDKNGKVTQPNEGINYVPGVGVEWYVRVDDETWNSLNEYAQKVGAATLGGAIARLLELEKK